MDINAIKQNKWARRGLWTIGGIVALWGVAWLAVPPMLKSQIEQRASEQLGRQVTLGAVDFKPWSLELTLHDLAVARSKGVADASPQLHIKRIYIDAELQSLLRLAPVLDAIEVEAPHVSLTHLGNGHYDVDDVLARLSQPPEQPAAAPLGFALYNLVLSAGSMDYTDQSVGKTHELRDLQIKLPFLSNLDSQRAVLVQPQLTFRLNGSPFDAGAQGTPFAQTRKMDATFKLTDLDLAPYLGYVPASLPVKLSSAVLNADLRIAFEQSPRMAVKLSGTLQAGKVRLLDKSANPEFLSFDLLKLNLTDVRPLERVAHLAALEWHGASLSVLRNKSGQLNLALLAKPQDATKNGAAHAGVTGSSGSNDIKNEAWKLAIDKVLMHGGEIHWTDEGTAPVARLGLGDLTLEASSIALPFVQPLQFAGSAKLLLGGKANPAAQLSFKGSATDQVANVTSTLADLPLAAAGPYLAQFMAPTLSGTLSADIGVHWKASTDPQIDAELLLDAAQLTLDGVALTQGKTRLASLKQLQVTQAQVNLARQTVTLGKLGLTQPTVAVSRDADGQWMFERWFETGVQTASTSAAQGKPAAAPAKPWGVVIQDLALDGGAVAFVDQSTPKPVALELAGLSVGLKNFSTSGSKPFGAQVSVQMRAGKTETGRLAWRGTAGLSPLAVKGQLEAVRLPVHVLAPYLADTLNIELLKAEASFKGRVRYAQTPDGPLVMVNGDSAIEEFQANSLPESLPIGDELLNWKLLSLRGLDLAIVPGKATAVAVQETVLSDFFARIILSAAGRFNLQDVMKTPAQTATSAPDATDLIASHAIPAGSTARNDAEEALKPVISFGPVSLVGGRVHFSDRFIQPNYSANLTELTGKLSAFSSVSLPGGVNLADLELRGRAEGTASLEILGKLNPLATPVVLDIKGRVRDLELPPLSPYSVRYAGYGIERGKLSVDVAYQILPDGQLTASNNIVLNQITFGDKVDGAPASLPVKLAVALLADRHGVIDINLPVSGSLNDPQFKLAPIVFKLIGNLILKAITSPFSLLASALGGGADELSMVSFAPGSAVLGADAKPGLDKIVKALRERPALKMTVVGTASLEVEREAYKSEQLQALVQAEKRRTSIVNGATPKAGAQSEGPGDAAGTVTAVEYPALLKAVYRRADFPKPRNLIGLAKDLPVTDMQALLLAHLPATEEAMRELAVQRGVAVRDYLAAQQLPLERLFLGAAKAVPPEAKWRPRAELNLTLD